jgi:hypothetical protein
MGWRLSFRFEELPTVFAPFRLGSESNLPNVEAAAHPRGLWFERVWPSRDDPKWACAIAWGFSYEDLDYPLGG